MKFCVGAFCFSIRLEYIRFVCVYVCVSWSKGQRVQRPAGPCFLDKINDACAWARHDTCAWIPEAEKCNSTLSNSRRRSQDFLFFACATTFSGKSQICWCYFEVVAVLFVFVTWTPWHTLAAASQRTMKMIFVTVLI